MTLFRARQYGSAEWTLIQVSSPSDEDAVPLIIASIIGSALGTSSLHVQQMDEEGKWEEME